MRMRVEPVDCNQIIFELSAAFNQGRAPELSTAAYEHIAACSRCRAGLLLLVRAFDSGPDRSGIRDSCAACQADLAAFIDLEAESPAQAATIYPHVWWHVWQCETCAQTYEWTHTLLQAQQISLLRPLRLSRQVVQKRMPIVKHMRIPRPHLARVLPAHTGLVMRSGDNRFVLFDDSDDEPEQHQFKVVVDEQITTIGK